MTKKPEQQANGKRSFKFTKASQAQPCIAKHNQARPFLLLLALSGASWGTLGGLLGRLGGLLGPLGDLLAALGALLGRSWGALGRSWGGLGAHVDFWSIFLPIYGATWLPKGTPKTTKTEPKTNPKSNINFDIEKAPLEDRLGAVLGRSWVVLRH